jgi:hypothetical protein
MPNVVLDMSYLKEVAFEASVHRNLGRRSSAWYRRSDLFVKCLISGFTPDRLKIWILSRPFR